jgi:holo-[acyl-carrier protein] synthase
MIYGIGVDIVKIERIRNNIQRFGERFAQRLLTEAELAEYRTLKQPERFLAKRFAAKEAVVKAMGTGFREGLAFPLIGVTHDALGKPGLVYSGAALDWMRASGITNSLLSLSDEQDYAVAFVILLTSG